MSYQFIENIVLKGKIIVVTGLHIGGSKEKLEIGGVDSPVIRNPLNNYPYVPGSSIKGKIRMSLEYALGKIEVTQKDGKIQGGVSKDPLICRIFGSTPENEKAINRAPQGPTRLIIRDANPDNETIEMWKDEVESELNYTELKPENYIDRLTSEANPRFLERVVAGSKFDVEIVYGIYDFDDNGKTDRENFKYVLEGLRLLEHSGLGGSISRGYGQIRFELTKPIRVTREDYANGSGEYVRSAEPLTNNTALYQLHQTEYFKID